MSKLLLCISFNLFFLNVFSQSSDLSDKDLMGIKNNFSKQEECWNKGDHECYVQAYYSAEWVQTLSRAGRTKGVKNILADYNRYWPKDRMGKLHFDEMEYKGLSNEYAYVSGRFNIKMKNREEPLQGWFSVLMQKIDGQWYIISDHSS